MRFREVREVERKFDEEIISDKYEDPELKKKAKECDLFWDNLLLGLMNGE